MDNDTKPTKITIYQQYLTGNDQENFDGAAYRAALETEYTEQLNLEFPNTEIEIIFDVQNSSGYCRPVFAEIENNTEISYKTAERIEQMIKYIQDGIDLQNFYK